MGVHTYTRPTRPDSSGIGSKDTDSAGDTIMAKVVAALPSKQFYVRMFSTSIEFTFQDTLSGAEETTLSGTVSAFTAVDPGVSKDWIVEVEDVSGNIKRYAVDNGDGTYAEMVEEVQYTKIGTKIKETLIKKYSSTGVLLSEEKFTFFMNGTSKVRKRV